MTLAQLRERLALGDGPDIEIISVEGLVYVVRIDAEHMLTATPGSSTAMCFRSAYAAGRALQEAGAGHAWLVHQSPYDEMIGRADEGQPHPAPLRTRVAITEL